MSFYLPPANSMDKDTSPNKCFFGGSPYPAPVGTITAPTDKGFFKLPVDNEKTTPGANGVLFPVTTTASTTVPPSTTSLAPTTNVAPFEKLRGRVTFCVTNTMRSALAFVDSMLYYFGGPDALANVAGEDDVGWHHVWDDTFDQVMGRLLERDVKFVNVIIVGGPTWTRPMILQFAQSPEVSNIFVHSRNWLEWSNAYTVAKQSGATVVFVECDGKVPHKPPVDLWLALQDKSWALTHYASSKFLGLSCNNPLPFSAHQHPIFSILYDGKEIAAHSLSDWITPHIQHNAMLIAKRENYFYNYVFSQCNEFNDDDGDDDSYTEGDGGEGGDDGAPNQEEEATSSETKPTMTFSLSNTESQKTTLPEREPAYDHNNPAVRSDGTTGWVIDSDGIRKYVPLGAPCCDDEKDYELSPPSRKASGVVDVNDVRGGNVEDAGSNEGSDIVVSNGLTNGSTGSSSIRSYGDEEGAYNEDDLDSEELYFQRAMNDHSRLYNVPANHVKILPPSTYYVPQPFTAELKRQAFHTYAAIVPDLHVFNRSSNKSVPRARGLDVGSHKTIATPPYNAVAIDGHAKIVEVIEEEKPATTTTEKEEEKQQLENENKQLEDEQRCLAMKIAGKTDVHAEPPQWARHLAAEYARFQTKAAIRLDDEQPAPGDQQQGGTDDDDTNDGDSSDDDGNRDNVETDKEKHQN